MKNKKAVIVFSGGMDSVTTLAYAKDRGFDCYTITFNYGQRSLAEINSATYYSKKYNCIDHKIFNIDFAEFSNSALTNNKIEVVNDNNVEIPVTYVPMRNIIFLSIACSWAETNNVTDIFIGANAIDYSGYPDCRDNFLDSYEKMVNFGSKSGVEGNKFIIHRPLVAMKKIDIIKLGHSLGVNYLQTVSCYQATADGKACGVCESCLFRKKAFEENELADETLYI